MLFSRVPCPLASTLPHLHIYLQHKAWNRAVEANECIIKVIRILSYPTSILLRVGPVLHGDNGESRLSNNWAEREFSESLCCSNLIHELPVYVHAAMP